MLRSVLMLMPEVPAVEERYLFGTGPFVLLAREFDANFVTHDERRYRFTDQWFAADPRLALGGPTLGWGRQAVRSMTAAVAPGYLERIDLPLVLISAGAGSADRHRARTMRWRRGCSTASTSPSPAPSTK